MSVRGYVGYFDDLFIVRSLEVITNLKKYGPFGKEEGTPFELCAPGHGGQIIGFHGRSGAYLDAIGVYALVLIILLTNSSKLDYLFRQLTYTLYFNWLFGRDS